MKLRWGFYFGILTRRKLLEASFQLSDVVSVLEGSFFSLQIHTWIPLRSSAVAQKPYSAKFFCQFLWYQLPSCQTPSFFCFPSAFSLSCVCKCGLHVVNFKHSKELYDPPGLLKTDLKSDFCKTINMFQMLRTGNKISFAVIAGIWGFHGNEMCGLFNKVPIGPNFSHNWVYLGCALLFMETQDVPGMWGRCGCGCVCVVYNNNRELGSRGYSSAFHYKRGKRWQGKIIIHLIFTIQPHNLTPHLFVVFVSAFDKIVKTELPFNKEPALLLCSHKNQHFTREAENCIPTRKSLFLPFTMWKRRAEGFLWLQNRWKTLQFPPFFCRVFHIKLLQSGPLRSDFRPTLIPKPSCHFHDNRSRSWNQSIDCSSAARCTVNNLQPSAPLS